MAAAACAWLLPSARQCKSSQSACAAWVNAWGCQSLWPPQSACCTAGLRFCFCLGPGWGPTLSSSLQVQPFCEISVWIFGASREPVHLWHSAQTRNPGARASGLGDSKCWAGWASARGGLVRALARWWLLRLLAPGDAAASAKRGPAVTCPTFPSKICQWKLQHREYASCPRIWARSRHDVSLAAACAKLARSSWGLPAGHSEAAPILSLARILQHQQCCSDDAGDDRWSSAWLSCMAVKILHPSDVSDLLLLTMGLFKCSIWRWAHCHHWSLDPLVSVKAAWSNPAWSCWKDHAALRGSTCASVLAHKHAMSKRPSRDPWRRSERQSLHLLGTCAWFSLLTMLICHYQTLLRHSRLLNCCGSFRTARWTQHQEPRCLFEDIPGCTNDLSRSKGELWCCFRHVLAEWGSCMSTKCDVLCQHEAFACCRPLRWAQEWCSAALQPCKRDVSLPTSR